jgi:hypothetical protein
MVEAVAAAAAVVVGAKFAVADSITAVGAT